ncbi:MAG TPA: hypothetical protein VGQ94_09685 [Terriglobales bacterium]|nr:hypothetical protein [Terriglobales bacterium]
MSKRFAAHLLMLFAALALVGCGSKPTEEPSSGTGPTKTSESKPPGLIERLTAKPVTVPEGTILTVRLNQAVGSKISNPGDSFEGSLADPVSVGKNVVLPEGSDVTGTVVDAKPLGRFKGGARLQLTLNSVTVKSGKYDIETTAPMRAQRGKGKRTAVMVGGGAGLGAVIGALAGGGKGAAIGAGVGAGAGTAGSAFTGNKNITIPSETLLEFKLTKPVTIKM